MTMSTQAATFGPGWLVLPSGLGLYLPDIQSRPERGCSKCGETIYVVTDENLCCPNPKCVRPKPNRRIIGRFDMTTLRLVPRNREIS
jgi:hypothetical protein